VSRDVIALDAVLREATTAGYRDLVTRPTGAAVRDQLVRTLRSAPRTEALLDFSRIGLVDYSCADEVVAKLIVAMQELPVWRVVLHGVREDQADAIEHALGRHGLAVLALELESRRPMLLGIVPDDARGVFAVLGIAVRTGTAQLAAQLAWDEERTQRALDHLADCRCILAHPDATYELGAFA
jgi:hypothetical protein